jgi:predicted transcriptional regulator
MAWVARYLGEVSANPLNKSMDFPASQEQIADNTGLSLQKVREYVWALRAASLVDVEDIEGRLFSRLTVKGKDLYQRGLKEALQAKQ